MQSNKDWKMTDYIWWTLVLKHMPWGGTVYSYIDADSRIDPPRSKLRPTDIYLRKYSAVLPETIIWDP